MRTIPFGVHPDSWGEPTSGETSPGRAARVGGLREEHIERAILPNGIDVLSRYLPDPDIVAISIGSRGTAALDRGDRGSPPLQPRWRLGGAGTTDDQIDDHSQSPPP